MPKYGSIYSMPFSGVQFHTIGFPLMYLYLIDIYHIINLLHAQKGNTLIQFALNQL